MENLPALSRKSSPSIIQDNLNALHSARAAFIASENNEKIRRALLRNVRTSSEITYVTTRDLVYYKRDNSNEWRGPGIVIGQVSQQVFIKHGSFHIRVHPCRLQLLKPATRTTDIIPNNLQPNRIPKNNADEQTPNNTYPNEEYSSDSEDDESNENPIINPEFPQNTTSNTSPTPKPKIQRNLRIKYKTESDSPWKEAIVTQRAGKATGKFSSWWNVEHPDGTSSQLISTK